MNIFSLGFPTTIEMYLNGDDLTKKNFSKVCKYFHYVARCADGASEVHRFITKHYEVLKELSSVKEFTVSIVFRWNVIFLCEFHCSAYHRTINSQLINMLWRQQTDVYLEADDDVQIPQVADHIKSQKKCWDNEDLKNTSLLPFLNLFHSVCEICKAYLNNIINGELIFEKFLKDYILQKTMLFNLTKNNTVGFEDFYSTNTLEEVCKEGSGEVDPKNRKKLVLKLLSVLKNEVLDSMNLYTKTIKNIDRLRNLSLVINAWKSINSNRFPIIIAGSEHAKSREVQEFSKDKRVLCIALKPHNKMKEIKPVDVVTDIMNCQDAETNEWSALNVLTRKLMTVGEDPQKMNDLFTSNENLFTAIKTKMPQYDTDLDQITNWSTIPMLIYFKDHFTLEKEIAMQSSV